MSVPNVLFRGHLEEVKEVLVVSISDVPARKKLRFLAAGRLKEQGSQVATLPKRAYPPPTSR